MLLQTVVWQQKCGLMLEGVNFCALSGGDVCIFELDLGTDLVYRKNHHHSPSVKSCAGCAESVP